ncbi:MAG: Gfo/Idh/MocA family oxidoreductase [Verrucomicrobiae bacterium]|nr:Gfo/Idh/MocA family oxidoreductase [Verrucomicrobiae bacterium]
MLSHDAFELDYKPMLPAKHDYGIASVGCGGISTACHLPIYRRHGLNVVGCFDASPEAREKFARAFSIPTVYSSLDELLADEKVQIVDIAVPATEQRRIVEKVASAGKHMLCQKPLAESFDDAKACVAAAKKHKVTLAVNQQLRWSPAIAATKDLLHRGLLGEPTLGTIQVNACTPWHKWEWIRVKKTIDVLYTSIHFLDSMRHLFGDPERIYVSGTPPPDGSCVGETRTIQVLEYKGSLRGLVHDEHHNIANADDWYGLYRVEGTEGIAKGRLGSLFGFLTGVPDSISFMSRKLRTGWWVTPTLEGGWFPDAFIGPMASLMESLQTGKPPLTSGEDHLRTLQLVFAAYKSMEEKRAVRPSEIQ